MNREQHRHARATSKELRHINWLRIGMAILLACVLCGYIALLSTAIMKQSSAQHDLQEINQYNNLTQSLNQQQLAQVHQQIKAYNSKLQMDSGTSVNDPYQPRSLQSPESYREVFAPLHPSIIGYLIVERINVFRPIHFGSGNTNLGEGIEHIASTAIPDSRTGIHPVLAGHSGSDESVVFDRLSELTVGDSFQVRVLDQTMHYRIDSVVTALPNEVEKLRVVPSENYVTLMTCTPIGINSHRLLVRGKLVSTTRAQPQTPKHVENGELIVLSAVGCVGLLSALIGCCYALHRRRANRVRENGQNAAQSYDAQGISSTGTTRKHVSVARRHNSTRKR